MFKQCKESREEGKTGVQVSKKTHGSIFCAEQCCQFKLQWCEHA